MLPDNPYGQGAPVALNSPMSVNRLTQDNFLIPTAPRGLSLTFAMFAELARRDGATIREAHDTIFNLFRLDEKSERFYRHINEIRAAMKRQPVLPDTASASLVKKSL